MSATMRSRASATLNALPGSGRACASSAAAASRKRPSSRPRAAQRLLGVPRPPRLVRHSAERDAHVRERPAVRDVHRGGHRHQRERVRPAVAHLAVPRVAATGGGGSSTAVIRSPRPSTVSRSGCRRAAGTARSAGCAARRRRRPPTVDAPRASSAASATAMSEGWVATQGRRGAEDGQIAVIALRGRTTRPRLALVARAWSRPGSTRSGCAAADCRRRWRRLRSWPGRARQQRLRQHRDSAAGSAGRRPDRCWARRRRSAPTRRGSSSIRSEVSRRTRR